MLAAIAAAIACLGGTLPPSSPPDELRPALRCLVNEARAIEGLEPLRGSPSMHEAAQAHADAMIAGDFFAHGDLMARALDAGLEEPLRLGEALGWGCGGLATPASIAAALLRSPPHRETLLDPDYRRMAIAVVPWISADGACPDPGTWVLDFVAAI
jgi:uncharacterized protein YkwD